MIQIVLHVLAHLFHQAFLIAGNSLLLGEAADQRLHCTLHLLQGGSPVPLFRCGRQLGGFQLQGLDGAKGHLLKLDPEIPQRPLIQLPLLCQGIQIPQSLILGGRAQPVNEQALPPAQLHRIQQLLHMKGILAVGGTENPALPHHIVLFGVQQQGGLAVDLLQGHNGADIEGKLTGQVL